VIWREGQIASLAAEALEAGALIDSRLADKRVDVAGAASWGQFLDDDHYSPHQWGLFGTTAAVRTLSLRASPVEANRHIREAFPLIPRDRTTYDARLQPKVDKGDFQNIIRLAFVAEALEPARDHIALGERPPIVQDILACSGGQPHWNATSAVSGAPPGEGDVFTTAYVLYALRRYEDPPGELREYRIWLANQLMTRRDIRSQPDVVALVGLALHTRRPDPHDPQPVRAAIERCREELLRWQARAKIVLDRPLFHGFTFIRWTDYVFMHPEIVASLFFLQIDNPRSSRRFVARVVEGLVENIDEHHYFEGRPGMGATVDQLWASRLLDAFYRANAEQTRRHILMPPLIATRRTRWILIVVALVVFAGLSAIIGPAGGAAGAAIAVLIAAVINVLVAWGFEKH
jgi:hypothetical protein